MKTNRMTSFVANSVTVLAACAALNASAGTAPAKAPVPAVEPEPSALFDSIGANLSASYDSRYYFRGLWFADNIVSTFLNLSVPLISGAGEDDAGSLTWGLGAGYISSVETPTGNPINVRSFDYSEIDAYTSLSYDAGFATFGISYQYYFYPDTYAGSGFGGVAGGSWAGDPEFGIRGNQEIGFTVAKSIGSLNLNLGYYYDMTIGGSYAQFATDYTFAVTDWLSIVPAFQIGWGNDYYTGNRSGVVTQINQIGDTNFPTSGLTHMLFSISAPVQLTKTATFTPYVALNNSQSLRSGLNPQLNEIFWGAKLSVAF
ncbi:MAG: hypothetical protein QE570_20420 [Verrucomicrobiota bacterium]|nr:hypothetical protein [Verrucomicrobiota bacterium]